MCVCVCVCVSFSHSFRIGGYMSGVHTEFFAGGGGGTCRKISTSYRYCITLPVMPRIYVRID